MRDNVKEAHMNRSLTERENRFLSALRLVETLADKFGTTSYVWGGLTTSLHLGYFYRFHHDIDLMIMDLNQFAKQFKTAFEEQGWHCEVLLNNHMLNVKKDDLKLHINNVVTKNGHAFLKFFGDDGAIVFPQDWLRDAPLPFYDTFLHVVEPQLLYVLKSNPYVCDPDYKQWNDEKRKKRAVRDIPDLQVFEKLLIDRNINIKSLKHLVSRI